MFTNVLEGYSYPSRCLTRAGIRNRRSMLRGALWPIAKAAVSLTAVFVRELLF
ncbi:hypothetical protein NST68_21310 [Paenibacillus sp. FSL E2-0230]|uniref:hypothetical protein n=1 Tax=Paenibacillus sp. FSL E2-0230 TaxID=2954727 RepID=UPI0030D3015B